MCFRHEILLDHQQSKKILKDDKTGLGIYKMSCLISDSFAGVFQLFLHHNGFGLTRVRRVKKQTNTQIDMRLKI